MEVYIHAGTLYTKYKKYRESLIQVAMNFRVKQLRTVVPVNQNLDLIAYAYRAYIEGPEAYNLYTAFIYSHHISLRVTKVLAGIVVSTIISFAVSFRYQIRTDNQQRQAF